MMRCLTDREEAVITIRVETRNEAGVLTEVMESMIDWRNIAAFLQRKEVLDIMREALSSGNTVRLSSTTHEPKAINL